MDKNIVDSLAWHPLFFQKSAIWSILSLIISAVVAYRIDTPCFKEKTTLRTLISHIGKGFFLGSVLTITSMINMFYVFNNGQLSFHTLDDPEKTKFVFYSMISFCMVFAISLATRINTIENDRRKDTRYKTNADIEVEINEKRYNGRLKNISKGGALIHSRDFIADQDESITIKIKDEEIHTGNVLKFIKGTFRISFRHDVEMAIIRRVLFQ